MLKTLKNRIIVVVTGIVCLTMLTLISLGHVEMERAIFHGQDQMTKNLLATVVLNVENEYNSLVFHRQAMLERRKAELRNISSLALNFIEGCYLDYQQGLVSEAEAQRRAIGEIERLRYDDGVGYVWINDLGRPIPRMIMHPTMPELDGQVLDDPKFDCALGQRKNLFQAFVEVSLADGQGFVDYLWPKPSADGLTAEQPKLSHVRLFRPWGWVVGTGLYIDDIELERQKRLDAILVELQQTFSKVKVGESGYMYLFNGKMEMLLHPNLAGADFGKLINPVSGNPILKDLALAAQRPDQPFDYLWEKLPEHPGQFTFWKRSYVAYYQPLDWYIGSSVYFEEKKHSASALTRKLLWLSLAFLGVALILALLLSKSLTLPLRRLIRSAQELRIDGREEIKIPVSGPLETRELGQILEQMISSIRKAVTEREELLTTLERSNLALKDANLRLEEEISVRRQAEAKITAALEEKEVLLREIHHRVKNNMAVIIGLLGLQASHISDPRLRGALEDSRRRVKAMAIIHESLYRSESMAEISLQTYTKNLVGILQQAMVGPSASAEIVVEAEEMRLGIDQAVPFGLILNELVTNALKYAFPDRRKGLIGIRVFRASPLEAVLEVRDNGVGLPPGFSGSSPDTLGMRIISLLVERQLEGSWTVANDAGARFTIRWPLDESG